VSERSPRRYADRDGRAQSIRGTKRRINGRKASVNSTHDKDSRRLSAFEPLERSRQRALGELERLPETLSAARIPVTVSERLKNLAREVDAATMP